MLDAQIGVDIHIRHLMVLLTRLEALRNLTLRCKGH
jgi:hypothetical protein